MARQLEEAANILEFCGHPRPEWGCGDHNPAQKAAVALAGLLFQGCTSHKLALTLEAAQEYLLKKGECGDADLHEALKTLKKACRPNASVSSSTGEHVRLQVLAENDGRQKGMITSGHGPVSGKRYGSGLALAASFMDSIMLIESMAESEELEIPQSQALEHLLAPESAARLGAAAVVDSLLFVFMRFSKREARTAANKQDLGGGLSPPQ